MDLNPNLIWLVFGLPLLGAIVQALGGKIITDSLGPKLGRQVAGYLATAMVAGAFLIALPLTIQMAQASPADRTQIVTLFQWIDLQAIRIPFEFRLDPLSMTMVLIITGIGSLIHLYSVGYMAEEKDFTRFFTYLNLFVAMMLVLVLGNNLALLFIGWEGVGLCSYLLIGFWYKDLKNSKAANKAFIVNRVGDVGLTLGMFYLVVLAATNKGPLGITDARYLSYDVLLPAIKPLLEARPLDATLIALLLFVGAMGKSAQFPLYVWLPDAMAGPTPVSALIHAATMVTSGVVLLNRMQDVFLASPVAMGVVALVGAATALIGALIAFGQTDIKKVLAYSTVSQLGFMFIGCGVGVFWAGFFHVLTHAFFKALLFLGSGAVIHAMAHEQDMRKYGSLQKYLPITYLTMGIGWAAIAGVPFLFSGFWSKEAILGKAVNATTGGFMIAGLTPGQIAGWVGFGVAALTACYMTRMMALTFGTAEERWRVFGAAGHGHHDDHHDGHGHYHAHGHHGHDDHHEDPHEFFLSDEEVERNLALSHEHHHDLEKDHQPHEVPWQMWVPLAVLAIFSFGWLGSWLYGKHGEVLEMWLNPAMTEHIYKEKGIPHNVLVLISFVVATAGIVAGLALYARKMPESEGLDESKWAKWRLAAREQFGIDAAVTDVPSKLGGVLGFTTWRYFDQGVIDGIVMGLGKVAALLAGIPRWFQSGRVRNYAFIMVVGLIAVMGTFLALALRAAGGAQ